MKLMTRYEHPPIPLRHFDWLAYDADQDICGDPECSCRTHVVQGWGATEHEAILDWVSNLLDVRDAPMPIVEDDNSETTRRYALAIREDVARWNRELTKRIQQLEVACGRRKR